MQSQTLIRRRHSGELKAQVLLECSEPGASVGHRAVARAQLEPGTQMAREVRRPREVQAQAQDQDQAQPSPFTALPAVQVPEPTPQPADIRIELRRGAATANVTWPVSAASECPVSLREWLR